MLIPWGSSRRAGGLGWALKPTSAPISSRMNNFTISRVISESHPTIKKVHREFITPPLLLLGQTKEEHKHYSPLYRIIMNHHEQFYVSLMAIRRLELYFIVTLTPIFLHLLIILPHFGICEEEQGNVLIEVELFCAFATKNNIGGYVWPLSFSAPPTRTFLWTRVPLWPCWGIRLSRDGHRNKFRK